MVSPEDAAMARKTGGKGPGGCKGKDECTALCDKPENQQMCLDFQIQYGLMTPEDVAKIQKSREDMRNALATSSTEVLNCLKDLLGNDTFVAMQAGNAMPPKDKGDQIQACFDKTPNGGVPTGPGGCSGQAECDAYCTAHPQECGPEGQGPGGPGPGPGPTPGPGTQTGPGGCQSPEECDAYCTAHPQECGAPPPGAPAPCEGENCPPPPSPVSYFINTDSLVGSLIDAAFTGGLFNATSKLYFLQQWGEGVRMFFTFSKEAKLDYLLTLTDKRAKEINTSASDSNAVKKLANDYTNNYNQAEKIATEVSGKENAVKKIEEANLRQQQVLADVLQKVPEQARTAITDAQENSAKHVEKIISDTQGEDAAQKYVQQVQQIQQAGKVAPVQMENNPNPNSDPSQNVPKELNSINQGNQLNQLNPINSGQQGQTGGGGIMQQAEPIPTNQLNQPPVPQENNN